MFLPSFTTKMFPEIDFLDINLPKRLESFCSVLFKVPFTGGFEWKPYSSLVLKILTKNLRNKKTRVYSWIAFVEQMRVENQTKTRVWEGSSLWPETSTKYAIQELHLCTFKFFSGYNNSGLSANTTNNVNNYPRRFLKFWYSGQILCCEQGNF